MSASLTKREAIKEYKARKPQRGIFAVRCHATAQIWVGSSMNLDAARNGLWFALKLGSHRDRSLQSAWNLHGEQSLTYEILEKLDEDVSLMSVPDLLKEKKKQWSTQYSAPSLL